MSFLNHLMSKRLFLQETFKIIFLRLKIQKEIIKNNRDNVLWFLEDEFVNKYFDEGLEELVSIKNKELFDRWITWVDRNQIDIKYNCISFNTRLAMLSKKQLNKDLECITKDKHTKTFINISNLKKFFDKLNQ